MTESTLVVDLSVGERALEAAEGLSATPKNILKLAGEFGDAVARWAFLQWELRRRASAKFELASEMLFTREALEQASAQAVADYHASRFPAGETVIDMTCGIGSDLIAIARRGPAIGYELDVERAEYARHNLGVYDVEAKVIVGDGLAVAEGQAFLFCDPSRRTGGQRRIRATEYQPSLDQVVNATAKAQLVGIKLSPMISDAELEPYGGAVEFLSFGRECREAILWLGKSAGNRREAVQVETGARLSSHEPHRFVSEPGAFVVEADPAAIRAHALGSLNDELNLSCLGESNGFLTGPFAVVSPWLRTYEPIVRLPFDLKRIRRELATRGLRLEAVKTRGMKLDANALAKSLRTEGAEGAVALVFPSEGRMQALICREFRP